MSVLLVVAFAALGLWGHYGGVLQRRAPGVDDPVMSDFRGTLYYPAVGFLEGHNPYDPGASLRLYPVSLPLVGYAPHMLLVNLPLALLPYSMATLIYRALMMALTGLLAYVALRSGGIIRGRFEHVLLLTAVLLITRPGQINFVTGHMALQFALAMLLALHYGASQPWLAALGLALCLTKPTLGLPLAALMLLGRGQLRATLLGAGLAGVLSIVVVAILLPRAGGPAALFESFRAGTQMFRALGANDPVSSWIRIDQLAILAKLAGRTPTVAIELVTAATILLLGVFGVRRLDSRDRTLADLLACLTILVFAYQQVYAALVLAPSLVWLLWGQPSQLLASRRLRLSLFVLLSIPFLNFGATVLVRNRLALSEAAWHLVTAVNPIALFVAWGLVWWLAMQPSSAPTRARC